MRELVVVGQFDPAAIQKLAAELFGQWKSPSRFERVPLPYAKVEPIERKFETPDKQNALFTAGMTTRMAMDDPDYPAAMLANRIFGGTFSSRICAPHSRQRGPELRREFGLRRERKG